MKVNCRHLFIVMFLCFFIASVSLGFWLKTANIENWRGSDPIETQPATWKLIDDVKPHEYIWDSMTPKDVEQMALVNQNSYLVAGLSADEVQHILDKRIKTNQFPTDVQLNTSFKWMAYKPRVIPLKVYEACIANFLLASQLRKDHGFILTKERVLQANVTSNDHDFLLTIQILVRQPNDMFSKVIQFTVLATVENRKINVVYKDALVVGVINEQNQAGKPVGFMYLGENGELYGNA